MATTFEGDQNPRNLLYFVPSPLLKLLNTIGEQSRHYAARVGVAWPQVLSFVKFQHLECARTSVPALLLTI